VYAYFLQLLLAIAELVNLPSVAELVKLPTIAERFKLLTVFRTRPALGRTFPLWVMGWALPSEVRSSMPQERFGTT
jgi:hypothetical protein